MSKAHLRIPYDLLTGALAPSRRAQNTYGVLACFADYKTRLAWPSHRTVAEKMNCSVPTVERGIRELRETGWITIERRKTRGPNVYHLNEAPVLTEAPAEQVPIPSLLMGWEEVHPIKNDGPIPSKVMAHSDVYTQNLETLTAPRAVAPPPDVIEAGFDPLEACGLFGTGPVISPAKEPGSRQLAEELRAAWARDRPQAMPGDINVRAIAGQMAALRRGGVTTAELRSMINLFVQVKGYLAEGAPPWKCFLARRHVLLLKVRNQAEAVAAETDPAYWQVKPVDAEEESRAWYAAQFPAVPA